MAYELRELQGTITPNRFKTESKHPDLRGDFLQDGEEWQLAIWKKPNGNHGFKISKKQIKPKADPISSGPGHLRKNDMDDDIPF